jgi:hypothetical protein
MMNKEQQALQSFNSALALSQKGVYFLERAKSNLSLGNKAQAQQDLRSAEQLGEKIDPQLRAQFQ